MKLEQKRLWCQHIKTLILDNYEAVIPDKAKELVMMLGMSRYEGEVTYRYLHCPVHTLSVSQLITQSISRFILKGVYSS